MGCCSRLALLITCLITPAASAALPSLPVDERVGHYDLTSQAEVLEDPDHSFTFEQVMQLPLADRFVSVRQRGKYLGYTKSAYFIRVSLANPTTSMARWYLEPFRRLDRVELYRPLPSGGVEHRVTGRAESIFER